MENKEKEEHLYMKQLKTSHSTPPDVSKVGRGTTECYCVRCGRKCTENTDVCPTCHSNNIKCYHSNI